MKEPEAVYASRAEGTSNKPVVNLKIVETNFKTVCLRLLSTFKFLEEKPEVSLFLK